MKLGPVFKLDKRNRTTSKNLMLTSYRRILTALSFFQFLANLQQSGSRILDAQSVKLIYSLIVTFYLAKTANKTKKSPTKLSHYWFQKRPKNVDFSKIAGISKIKRALVLKDKLSETKYVCLLTYVCVLILTKFRKDTGNSKQTPKKPTKIRVKCFVT